MLRLVRLEWIKTFHKWRTYIGFAAIGFFLPLFFIAVKLGGETEAVKFHQFSVLKEHFIIMGNLFNAFLVTRMLMMTFFVHIPFLIALMAGDVVAGEATTGTLRMILTRPPSRLQLILAKIVISLLYTFILIMFMATLSFSLGYLLFGFGELVLVNSNQFAILTATESFWRCLLAYALAFLAMSVVAALAFLFSVLVENAIGPIVGTMTVVIISLIISEAPISLFKAIRPYLFTTYASVWMKAFSEPLPWQTILISSGYLILFMLFFFGVAYVIFQRKDILC